MKSETDENAIKNLGSSLSRLTLGILTLARHPHTFRNFKLGFLLCQSSKGVLSLFL